MIRFLQYVGWWCTRKADKMQLARDHAKQAACKHEGWHTGHVCCPHCGATDGC